MALPKEPRQKMINMMYLVLTALLALNVSSEILNAFKTVNNSINTSNRIIDDKNAVTYKSFEEKLKDQQTAAKAAIWKPKADQAKKLSADLFAYLEDLKLRLKKESGLEVKDGVEHFKEDNLDATTRLMDKQGEGKKLYEKLGTYKQQMLAILNPAEFASDPILQKTVQKAKDDFMKSLPISLEVPKSQSGNQLANNAEGWTTNYFHMTPSIAGLTILSKFQNDVKNSESQMVDWCHQQIGAVKVVFNEFQPIAQANTSYAMPGDEIEITAGVGAFSTAAKPRITIGGQSMPLTNEGTAVYKTTANGTGTKVIPVHIEYTKPDGSTGVLNRDVKYEVGMPSGASVFLEKMNVMYVGVENPITISGGSVGAEKVQVRFAGGSISRASGDHWIAKPTQTGMSEITVIADGKPYKFPMRLKSLPPPTGFVGTSKGGRISAAQFKAQGGLIARLEDSEFQADYRIVSYILAANGGNITSYQPAPNEGNRWTGAAKAIVDRASPGTTIFFDQIRVVGPDGKIKEITPMVFQLQ
ncbi:MAG TPA: gliding motility protein GldM [Flavipsychrobacter sp.]|nr:gliding motility protein GldM [Flavipsychrobacter sp.]